jgi:cytochrome c oxidase assembly factor CtaG
MDLGALILVLAAEALYLRALRVLRGRGVVVPRWQVAAWHGGMALWAIGFFSPVHTLGEELLSAHMAQHLLIADLAAPLLLVGARNPVLAFLLPRTVTVTLARSGRLRRAFRTLRKPLVAVVVYALVLYGWHFAVFFEAAVRYPVVHAVQHMSFVAIGVLVWWAALEPKRRRVPGELWKVPYLIGARMVGMFLGMSFVLIRVPIYTGVYAAGDRGHGLDAVPDQQLAGAMMVTVDLLIMAFALCFFFFRSAQDADRREAAHSTVSVPSMPPSRWPGTEQ